MATLEGSYNGLTFGTGTSYHVSGVEGLWDVDGVEQRDLGKIGNGFFVGRDRMGGRRLILTLTLIADTHTAYDTLVSDLIDATEPGAGDNLLTANQASIETDATGWGLASNATLSRTTGIAGSNGPGVLAMTSAAAGDMAAYTTPQTQLVGGRRYTGLASFRAATAGRTVRVAIQWQRADTSVISTTTSADFTSTTTGWLGTTVAGVAPNGTTQARLAVVVVAGGASEVHYVDSAALHQGSGTTWTDGGRHMRLERPLRLMGNTVYVNARPRRRIIPIATDRYQRTGTAVIEFFASNPTVYSGAP